MSSSHTASPRPAVPRPELGLVHRQLAEAADAKLLRVVGMLDQMAERGDADALLAPMRRRLRGMHPARPLRLTRLLFLPIDTLIVDAGAWRADRVAVPRTALTPLTGILRGGAASLCVTMEAALVGVATADAEQIRRLGASLWPAAGAALAAAPLPHTWSAAGLPDTLFAPSVAAIAAILAAAPELHRLENEGEAETPAAGAVFEALLDAAGTGGDASVALVLHLLLSRFGGAAARRQVAASMRHADRARRVAAMAAIEAHLATAEHSAIALAALPLSEAAGHVTRAVAALDGLASDLPEPARNRRIQQAKASLRAGCEARFAQCVASGFAAEPGTAEATARALRRFESAARALGGVAGYEAGLAQAAAGAAGRGRVARARLVEILLGLEAAMAVLSAPG